MQRSDPLVPLRILILFCGIVIGAALFSLLFFLSHRAIQPTASAFPELAALPSDARGLREYAQFFQDLAKSKGARYAFAALRVAPLPPNLDLHLLGHFIGDELYKQEGIVGITACTQDFRNACSHSVVIGHLLARGPDGLPEIAAACRDAPGGPGAYTMCFHGLGHGVFAYTDYDLGETIRICTRTGTAAYRHQEAIECVGGAIMELFGEGGHDPARFLEQRPKYLTSDPLAPCNTEMIPQEFKPICYTYLTPHLFMIAGADLAAPTAENFSAAFQYCSRISERDARSRDACYGGFGKEFVVLAQDRDIRDVGTMNDERLARVYQWCLLADTDAGVASCIIAALNSLYWGGENDPGASIRFCTRMPNATHHEACIAELIDIIWQYAIQKQDGNERCQMLPDAYRKVCKDRGYLR